MVVAIAVGRSGVDALLVASQVVLSIVLPFIIFPLLWLTSSKTVMSVKSSPIQLNEQPQTNPDQPPLNVYEESRIQDLEADSQTVSFANGKFAIVLGSAIFIIVVAANVYAIVTLAMGKGG